MFLSHVKLKFGFYFSDPDLVEKGPGSLTQACVSVPVLFTQIESLYFLPRSKFGGYERRRLGKEEDGVMIVSRPKSYYPIIQAYRLELIREQCPKKRTY